MVDDSSAATVLHHEHLDVLSIAYVHAVKTIVAAEAVPAVSTETDAGHLSSALEATTHGVIDTMGLPPSVTETKDGVAVIAVETTSGLLELLHLQQRKKKITTQQTKKSTNKKNHHNQKDKNYS